MKLTTIRNYKNYSVIYLNEISLKAFKESREQYDLLHANGKNAVVKFSKKAWINFSSLHTLSFKDLKKGDKITLLDTTYKILRPLNMAKKEWYPIVRYYDRIANEDQEVGFIQSENVAWSVIEHSYHNCTGLLIGY